MNYSEIYSAHEKIGFPELSKEQQLKVIVDSDYSIIFNLVPDLDTTTMPTIVLQKYLNITKEELKAYLIEINYIKQKLDDFSKTQDGFWLTRKGSSFEFLSRDRGEIEYTVDAKNEDEVLDIFIKGLQFYIH